MEFLRKLALSNRKGGMCFHFINFIYKTKEKKEANREIIYEKLVMMLLVVRREWISGMEIFMKL